MEVFDKLVSFILVVVGLILSVVAIPVALPIVGVVLLVRFIIRKARPPKLIEEASYKHLDEAASPEKVAATIQPYADDAVLGPYVKNVMDSFTTSEMRRKGIFSVMEQEFERNSMTWDKFSAPVEVALESILHNNVQIANFMQAFDSKEYQRMGRLQKAGAYKPDSPEIKRLETMGETLEKMDQIQKGNDKLLAELERLQAELTRMSGAGYDAETEEIAAEIAKLAEETQYYTAPLRA